MGLNTWLNHGIKTIIPPENEPLTFPTYQSNKFLMPDFATLKEVLAGEKEGYFYGRFGNPTVKHLENQLAAIQDRNRAITVASGVAAISTTLLTLLQAGDHVIMFVESYKPTRYLIGNLLKRYGVTSSLLSIRDHDSIEECAKKNMPKLLIFESPTNPMCFIADLSFLTNVAKRYGILTVFDNTFAGPHNHSDFPVDIFLHSLSKYVGGHGDVFGGAIISSNDEIMQEIWTHAGELGPTLDPHAASLLLRGLKTYGLRYQRACETAEKLARWLSAQPSIERVLYPGLADHPQHELAKTQQKDFGTIVTIDLDSRISLECFLDKLKLFKLAASLGSTESLVAPCHLFYAGDLNEKDLEISEIKEKTVRLSVGLEDPDDLIQDLSVALA